MQLPASIQYGKVVGRSILAIADGPDDEDLFPDAAVPSGASITFRPVQEIIIAAPPTLVIQQTITCGLDSEGYLKRLPVTGEDPETIPLGVWLVAGQYDVDFSFPGAASPDRFRIQVTSAHDDDNPLDLTTVMPAPSGLAPIPQWQLLTQAQFDALPATDPNVLYLIGE